MTDDESAHAELDVGKKIKAIRKRNGLTLRALGTKTGFSASFLSQVERGVVSPSLSSLGRITHGLGVSVSAILTEPAATASPVVRRRQPRTMRSEWSRATIQSLLPTGTEDGIEAILITIEPGGRIGETPLVHTGKEFAFCVKGRATLLLEGETHELSEGDSVYFDASRLRQWENRKKRNAEILLVIVRSP